MARATPDAVSGQLLRLQTKQECQNQRCDRTSSPLEPTPIDALKMPMTPLDAATTSPTSQALNNCLHNKLIVG